MALPQLGFLLHSFLALSTSPFSVYAAALAACPSLIVSPSSEVNNKNTTSPVLWTLSTWETDYTLSDGGSIIFRLANLLTGYDTLCFRRGLYPEGYCISGATPTDDNPGTTSSQQENNTTATLFTYCDRVRLLEVYQEWDCAASADNTIKRVQAQGRAMVVEPCCEMDPLSKGEICGAQGGGGKIYAEVIQINPSAE